MESPTRIWILEDDLTLCDLLSRRFQPLGWQTRAFERPRSFDRALAEETPSLLVLDEMLPDRRGVDVVSGLRLQGHGFPVLMLSAMRTPQDRIAGLEAGADDYLGKPFEFRELQLRIERLLNNAALAPAVPPPSSEAFRLGQADGDGLNFHVQSLELQGASGQVTRISRGEAALLQALCRRPGEVIGRSTLARASGSLVDVSQSRSIDVRMGRLRRLLATLMPEGGELIESCRGKGYRLLVPVAMLDTPDGGPS